MKFEGLNILRGIAAFFIVGCHVALSPMTDVGWRIHDICDMNVGLFAAISGFLMWKATEDQGTWLEYAKKRASRLLPIYCIWTFVFVIFGFVFDFAIRHSLNEKWLDCCFIPKVIFGGQASAHLWFLICLFYIQLAFQALDKLIRRVPIIVLLIVGLGVSWLSSIYMDIWLVGYPVRMAGFVLTGYVLRMLVSKMERINGFASAMIMMFALSLVGIHVYVGKGIVPIFVKDWIVVVPLLLAFVYLRISERAKKIGNILGATSLGVYLIHPLITAGTGIVMKKLFCPPFGCVPILVDMIACWLVAIVITFVLARMNLTKRLVA